MIKGLFIALYFFVVGNAFAQQVDFLTFGGAKNDFGLSLLEMDDGESIIVGGSTRSYGEGSSDFYFLRLNENFKVMNEVHYGGPHADVFKSLAKNSNDHILLLGSSYDFVPGGMNFNLTRVDHQGNFLERKVIWKNLVDAAYKVLVNDNNEIVLFGMSAGPDSFGQSRLFILNQENEVLLEKDYGASGVRDYGFDILQNAEGYQFLSTKYCEIEMSAPFGGFSKPSDVNVVQVNDTGAVLWEYHYLGEDFDYAFSFIEEDGYTYVAMNSRSEGADGFDIRILKLDDQGELVDSFSFEKEGYQYAYRLIVDSNGDLLICGTTAVGTEKPSFYALKFSKEGEVIWEKEIAKEVSIYAYDLIERSNGNYLFTGKYAYSRDHADLFILEMDVDGAILPKNELKNENEFVIYPNPSEGSISINSGGVKLLGIFIYSSMGQLVRAKDVEGVTHLYSMDLSELSGGIYIVEMVDEFNQSHQQKITIY